MDKEKIKDIFRTLKNSRWSGFIVIAAIFILFALFNPRCNIPMLIKARYEVRQQEKLIQERCEEIKEMDCLIHNLKENKDSIEHFAREEFHLCEPGDDVYLIEK